MHHSHAISAQVKIQQQDDNLIGISQKIVVIDDHPLLRKGLVQLKNLCSDLETLAKIKQIDPERRVIILTVSDQEPDVINALRNGADGYLLFVK